jgi:phage gp46-like protein
MDIRLIGNGYGWDTGLDGSSLSTDSGLETAVVISLFTDRRAESDDTLPGWSGDRRGWWADVYSEYENDRIGSRLWLLAREKTLPAVLERAKEYAREALAWMIEDGLAAEIHVEAERGRNDILGLSIDIVKPSRELVNFTYQDIWESMTHV